MRYLVDIHNALYAFYTTVACDSTVGDERPRMTAPFMTPEGYCYEETRLRQYLSAHNNSLPRDTGRHLDLNDTQNRSKPARLNLTLQTELSKLGDTDLSRPTLQNIERLFNFVQNLAKDPISQCLMEDPVLDGEGLISETSVRQNLASGNNDPRTYRRTENLPYPGDVIRYLQLQKALIQLKAEFNALPEQALEGELSEYKAIVEEIKALDFEGKEWAADTELMFARPEPAVRQRNDVTDPAALAAILRAIRMDDFLQQLQNLAQAPAQQIGVQRQPQPQPWMGEARVVRAEVRRRRLKMFCSGVILLGCLVGLTAMAPYGGVALPAIFLSKSLAEQARATHRTHRDREQNPQHVVRWQNRYGCPWSHFLLYQTLALSLFAGMVTALYFTGFGMQALHAITSTLMPGAGLGNPKSVLYGVNASSFFATLPALGLQYGVSKRIQSPRYPREPEPVHHPLLNILLNFGQAMEAITAQSRGQRQPQQVPGALVFRF